MRVISYNCQNFKDRNRRELVMSRFSADYIGVQGTRMEADRLAEVVKEKIGVFHLYHFGYKGAKNNDRNTHAGLTMCFKEDPMNILEVYAPDDDPDIAGRCCAIRFRGKNLDGPGEHDNTHINLYFPCMDHTKKTWKIVHKMFVWLQQIHCHLPQRTSRFHTLDGNFRLGLIEGEFPGQNDAIGPNRQDNTSEVGLLYRATLMASHMKCDSTWMHGGGFSTYYSAKSNTRPDFISSENYMKCKYFHTLRKLGLELQLSQMPCNRDHCPILAEFKGMVWHEVSEAARPDVNVDKMMHMWLTGTGHAEFLAELEQKIDPVAAELRANEVDTAWKYYERTVMEQAKMDFKQESMSKQKDEELQTPA